MRVLAIGGTGFIGQQVVRLLLEHGHEVGVFHRGESASVPEGARSIPGDRDRLNDSSAEVARFRPEVVLDAILYTEQQAREMVQAFRGRVRRLIVLSSADVYRNYDGFRGKATAPPDAVPLTEDAPLRETRYPYRGKDLPFAYADDYDKILVEQVMLGEPELASTVLRLPAVYGPGDRQHRLREYLRRMADARATLVLSEVQASWHWTRSFVGNVAAAVALAVTDPRSDNHVYNVGDEPTLTEREWVERIGVAVGWRGKLGTVPAAEFRDESDQTFDWRYELWTDTTRLRSDLGYLQPVPLDEALRCTVAWETSQMES